MKAFWRTIKAIIFGCVFIITAILLLQLAYIFIAVGYNALAQSYPVLNDIVGIFRYIVGIPVFITIMFIGGYLTASVAVMESRIKVILLCVTVGLLTAGGMLYPTLEGSVLTITGIVVFTLSIIATTVGGLYWKKGYTSTS